MSPAEPMGGAIPLQQPTHNQASEFPYPENAHTLWVNSGRAALQCLLQALPTPPRTVWLPRFICNTLSQATTRLRLHTEFYGIDEQMFPILPDNLKEEDALVVVNYFGLTPRAVTEAVQATPCRVIMDASTAFYSPAPAGVAAFYSPRKFTGLADGGIALAPYELRTDLPYNTQSDHLSKLLLQNRSEQAVQQAEDALDSPPLHMGKITRQLMLSTDWTQAALQRLSNYRTLHRALAEINRLSLPDTPEHAPMSYPLVCGIPGLRDSLINQGVRLPLYWPEVIAATEAWQAENRLARTLLPLPLDQRYSTEDMQRLLRLILD